MCKCSECGKEFKIRYLGDWTYKTSNGKGLTVQCSYSCWRNANSGRFTKYEDIVKANIAEDSGYAMF